MSKPHLPALGPWPHHIEGNRLRQDGMRLHTPGSDEKFPVETCLDFGLWIADWGLHFLVPNTFRGTRFFWCFCLKIRNPQSAFSNHSYSVHRVEEIFALGVDANS